MFCTLYLPSSYELWHLRICMIGFEFFFPPSANCIVEVWNHGSALQPCKCPLCRRQITLLIPSEASRRQHPSAEASDILQRVDHYNRLFGERPNGLYQVPFFLHD